MLVWFVVHSSEVTYQVSSAMILWRPHITIHFGLHERVRLRARVCVHVHCSGLFLKGNVAQIAYYMVVPLIFPFLLGKLVCQR